MVSRTPGNIKRTPYIPPPKSEPPPDGTQVRCIHCDRDLIGIWKGDKLHVKYRERDMMITGTIEVHCRYCKQPMSIDTHYVTVDVHQMPFGVRPDDWFSLQEALLTVSNDGIDATEPARKLAEESGIDLKMVADFGQPLPQVTACRDATHEDIAAIYPLLDEDVGNLRSTLDSHGFEGSRPALGSGGQEAAMNEADTFDEAAQVARQLASDADDWDDAAPHARRNAGSTPFIEPVALDELAQRWQMRLAMAANRRAGRDAWEHRGSVSLVACCSPRCHGPLCLPAT